MKPVDGESLPASANSGSLSSPEDGLHHFTTPTLAHLMALLAHPTDYFPPANTSLIVIDSLSELVALAFPRTAEDFHDQKQQKRSEAAQWASGRRWAVISDLTSKLGRLAVTRNIAVLIINQVTTRVRADTGALLYSAITGTAWESAVANRVSLFRDWLCQTVSTSQSKPRTSVRFAGVLKAKGATYGRTGKVVAFVIEKNGLREIKLDESELASLSPDLANATLKRKRDETAGSQSGAEDLESEIEYDWEVEDRTLLGNSHVENG
ncbi:uncharacterized protein KY384_003414 [Bacidia gigantensis]|uniref:uncharacterized protein n=1 Tax=Bacidia gigantensis TaxID=2732470 RepID=UPI001D040024|nr:uncharacterized protein KY384_003414 [Bacidia gigantensis]KAG8531778.1 hypothetical protein KY384_003414 [Bacidia gigantensis]